LLSVLLFATETGIKYSKANQTLYVYIKSKEPPKSYFFEPLGAKNAKLTLLKKFSYFHNGNYYTGRKYLLEFKDSLLVHPIKITYNSKTYTTKAFFINPTPKSAEIFIKVKHQHSNFTKILTSLVFLYLGALYLIYVYKTRKIKEDLGYYDNDIKKLYYYLAKNGFEEVEILNKNKNVFYSNVRQYNELVKNLTEKIAGREKFVKEGYFWLILLIVVIAVKEALWK